MSKSVSNLKNEESVSAEVYGGSESISPSLVDHMPSKRVNRPWGGYQSLTHGDRHQIKVITVKPGERLSLQKHFHRSEYWIVIKGTAEVLNGNETFILYENQSTYIPVGEVHRLANPGKIQLEIVEVQVGGYLGEDDIIRYDDAYGRVDTSHPHSLGVQENPIR